MTKEMLKVIKEAKRRCGRVSVPWIQYKFHVSFSEAQRILIEFQKG